ncbi:hypothetical protein FHG87_005264 [Trinorchestia longiramus]|nr:hypothetical protein FHG87_005264 [Trinorchestia longiramus]
MNKSVGTYASARAVEDKLYSPLDSSVSVDCQVWWYAYLHRYEGRQLTAKFGGTRTVSGTKAKDGGCIECSICHALQRAGVLCP